LLVVAAGQTRARDLRRASEALSLVHAKTIGVVLNEVTKSTGYGYGYGYGYGKRYGYGQYASTGAAADGDAVSSTFTAAIKGNGARPVGVAGAGRHSKSGRAEDDVTRA
jgi:hypothetical protein